jgi:pyruvate/2-oxoglutarate dehydrogenase complex dihydrolipoamide acyltransferase (E2) component
VEEVDMTELETLRAAAQRPARQGARRLTVLPFLVRAIVLAVREHPQINARYDDEAKWDAPRFGAVHLGIATQTEGGLMVPVIRHAETLDLWACAAEVLRLAEAARSGKATRDELSGSTITITSLGALGGIVTTPVINHPEVAIVGVNRMVERPMVRNGRVVARQMMNLSSSFDHRVVDGMDAAEFVQRMRGCWNPRPPCLWSKRPWTYNTPACSSSAAAPAAMWRPSAPRSSACHHAGRGRSALGGTCLNIGCIPVQGADPRGRGLPPGAPLHG